MTFNCQRSKQGPLGIFSGDYRIHKLENLLVMGGKRSILQDCVKCVLHIRSEVKLNTSVNSVLFRFTKTVFF